MDLHADDDAVFRDIQRIKDTEHLNVELVLSRTAILDAVGAFLDSMGRG